MRGLKKELGLIGLKDGRISVNGTYFGNRIYNDTVN